jgi:hypothetical protein
MVMTRRSSNIEVLREEVVGENFLGDIMKLSLSHVMLK